MALPEIKPEFYGEIFQSKTTGRFHWRLRNYSNQKIVSGSSGGSGRGYTRKIDATDMFFRVHRHQWPIRKVG